MTCLRTIGESMHAVTAVLLAAPVRYEYPRAARQQPLAGCNQVRGSVVIQSTCSAIICIRYKEEMEQAIKRNTVLFVQDRTFCFIKNDQGSALEQHACEAKQLPFATAV
jgi:hypothetical protein